MLREMHAYSRLSMVTLLVVLGCGAGTTPPDPNPLCKPRAATYLIKWINGVGSCPNTLPEERRPLAFPVGVDDGCTGTVKPNGTCVIDLSETCPASSGSGLATITGSITFDVDGTIGRGQLKYVLKRENGDLACSSDYQVTYTRLAS
jgi:hypothetical protein